MPAASESCSTNSVVTPGHRAEFPNEFAEHICKCHIYSHLPTALLLICAAVLYYPTLYELVLHWANDPSFSHGFLVVPFAAYLAYMRRDRFSSVPHNPTPVGLIVLLCAMALLIVGSLGAELFIARLSFIITLAALVLLRFGAAHLRVAFAPLAVLLLMIPIPNLIFNEITFPLQLFASRLAEVVLPWFGVPVYREGNIIGLAGMDLEVAQACSGIRSLLALTTLGLMYAYFAEHRTPMRLALVLACVPIAVAVNVCRLVATGLAVAYWDPTKAMGFFHEFSGWLTFMLGVFLLVTTHRLMTLRPRTT